MSHCGLAIYLKKFVKAKQEEEEEEKIEESVV